MEDDITLTCPCCNSKLSIDDYGDAVLVEQAELPRGSTRTHKGLVVVDADPDWREQDYLRNQQVRASAANTLRPPASFTKLVEELEAPTEPEPIEPNPEVLAAATKDLRDKGIL